MNRETSAANPYTAGMAEFARRWDPILDVCRDAGVRYAFEVHPGQIAFDLYSAEMALDALGGREEFGFLFDPCHLHWQGVDPAEFVRRFPDRIYHVHIKDVALTLNGRSGVLNSYLPQGDPRRGWDFRSLGHGAVNFEEIVRALNQLGYDGPRSVEWEDSGMDREHGAREAAEFVKRVDFKSSGRAFDVRGPLREMRQLARALRRHVRAERYARARGRATADAPAGTDPCTPTSPSRHSGAPAPT